MDTWHSDSKHELNMRATLARTVSLQAADEYFLWDQILTPTQPYRSQVGSVGLYGVGKSGSCCFWVVVPYVVHRTSVACDVGPRTKPENSVKMGTMGR